MAQWVKQETADRLVEANSNLRAQIFNLEQTAQRSADEIARLSHDLKSEKAARREERRMFVDDATRDRAGTAECHRVIARCAKLLGEFGLSEETKPLPLPQLWILFPPLRERVLAIIASEKEEGVPVAISIERRGG